jgi:hypothetical protein
MSALTGLVLACSGHVLIDLPIFMGPVVLLGGWLLVVTRRARRQEGLHEDAPTQAPERKIPDNLIGLHA